MKRTVSLIVFLLISLSLHAVPVDPANSFSREIGVEITKPSKNIIKVVSGQPDTIVDTLKYESIEAMSEISVLDFGNPTVNIETGEITGAATPSFQVVFSVETQGTILVYFSSKQDLGYYETEPEKNYQNPFMMMSVEGHGLNYKVDLVPNAIMNDKTVSKTPVTFTPASRKNGFTKIEEVNIDGKQVGSFMKIKSGLVFTRKFDTSPFGGKGLDTYTLSLMNAAKGEGYEAGFYNGYIVIHFSAN